jgi:CheY-like chemotaxis protein
LSQLDLLPVSRLGDQVEAALAADPPLAAIFDAADPDGVELCAAVRRSPRLDLLTIALIPDAWGDAARDAFALGADECVPSCASAQLAETLLTLRTEGPAVGAVYSGTVVVAATDRARRAALGRQLRRTGLDVQFALDGAIAATDRLRLIVAEAGLPPDGGAASLRAYRRAHGAEVPWILFGAGAQLATLERDLDGEPAVALFDLGHHASQILFAAHGLLSAAPAQRRTVRQPYETPARWHEGDSSRWGYTYNINAGGLYVRTLIPPPTGVPVTLELRPPFGRGRAIVDGTVVWRQPWSARRGQPPGFGLKYAATLAVADAAALEAGYEELCRRHEAQPEETVREPRVDVA